LYWSREAADVFHQKGGGNGAGYLRARGKSALSIGGERGEKKKRVRLPNMLFLQREEKRKKKGRKGQGWLNFSDEVL